MRTTEHPIKVARKRQEMTLEQLSGASGVHISNISRVERRLQEAKIDTYKRLARALGVKWRDLVED